MTLEEENIILRKKLQEAQTWMAREVEKERHEVQNMKYFIGENISFHEYQAQEKIQAYFPPEVYLHLSKDDISCLVSSELTYSNILEGESIDGMNVVLGYHKVLDSFVEKYITQGFRKYIGNQKFPQSHDPLESFFEQVQERNYSLSVGRLYQILERIQQKEVLTGYQKSFYAYLCQDSSLKKALLESDFFVQCGKLIDAQYIGEKRHSGFLEAPETQFVRELYVGKLRYPNSLLGILASTQAVSF